jgi:GntR family transcriptional regulator
MHQQRIAMQDNQSQSASPEKPKGAWTRIDNAVLPVLAKIGAAAGSVYLALKSYADRDGACYPSVESVARLAGVNERTCMRYLAAFVERGLIQRRRRNRGSGRTSNLYRFAESPHATVASGVEAQVTKTTHGVTSPSDKNDEPK